MLARHYEAAILTLDGVVLDAIANGNSSAGLKARQLCAEAARRKAEEAKMLEGEEGEKKAGGLSVEAVTAHTQQGSSKDEFIMSHGGGALEWSSHWGH